MKTKLILLFAAISVLSGCDKDPNNGVSIASIDGLSLYWDHEVFGEEGRSLRFEFYGKKEFENSYEMIFEYAINHKVITIRLVDMIDNGKCQTYPMADGIDSLCAPRGRLSIPDSLLQKGTYTLSVETSDCEIKSELIVGDEKFSLNIPQNSYFSSSITEVYPIPANLLFGGVVYSGDENTESANSFFNDLLALGLTEANVPNYPYRHLSVDENGNAIDSHWPPDNHCLSFIYNMDHNFTDIFNVAVKDFNESNINIYLYSGQGDEARLDKIQGILVNYAD